MCHFFSWVSCSMIILDAQLCDYSNHRRAWQQILLPRGLRQGHILRSWLSWIRLAYLVTNVSLPPAEIKRTHCLRLDYHAPWPSPLLMSWESNSDSSWPFAIASNSGNWQVLSFSCILKASFLQFFQFFPLHSQLCA